MLSWRPPLLPGFCKSLLNVVPCILFVFTQLFLHTVARVVQLKCQSAHTTLMLRTLQWLLLTKAYKRPCVIWCLGVSAASSLTTLTLVCAALSTLALQEEVCSCLKGSAHFSPFWDVHLSVCPLGALLTSVVCLLKCHPLTEAFPALLGLWNSHHHLFHCFIPSLYLTWPDVIYLIIVLYDIRVPESYHAMQNCTTGFMGKMFWGAS